MKTFAQNIVSIYNRWTRFIAMMLIIALIVPSEAMSQLSPSPVNLGTAGNFVILAKTGISSTGTTDITGDIGVSPVAATYITGFGLIMDPSGVFSTSSLVTGNVYAADYTDPTPTQMTTAVGDMETAYTDAAGRTLPDYTELYAGDVTGQTLTPGLYKWGTGVLISAAGVTISGKASDVWIFQIAHDLTLANGAIVTLSDGAQASNIFWQVAGQVTLGTTSAMKGIILSQTLIEMQTGATLNGRALAQTAVALDATTITKQENVTIIKDNNNLTPDEYALYQNYPNPFNPSSTIRFALPNKTNFVKIIVADILGKEIIVLINEEKNPGEYEVTFDAKELASGIYFYMMRSGDFVKSMKMILMK
ncbi:MAG: ice-binding family protein [bacterium]